LPESDRCKREYIAWSLAGCLAWSAGGCASAGPPVPTAIEPAEPSAQLPQPDLLLLSEETPEDAAADEAALSALRELEFRSLTKGSDHARGILPVPGCSMSLAGEPPARRGPRTISMSSRSPAGPGSCTTWTSSRVRPETASSSGWAG